MALSDSVFRIANENHSNDLSGEGAYLFGGRWNSAGTRMLYTSENSSLSILEVLVYTTKRTFNSKEIITIELPTNSVMEIPLRMLEKGWDSYPATGYTKRLGDNWVQSNESLALIVPSVVNPREKNVLINPSHSLFSKVRIIEIARFSFDRRLF